MLLAPPALAPMDPVLEAVPSAPVVLAVAVLPAVMPLVVPVSPAAPVTPAVVPLVVVPPVVVPPVVVPPVVPPVVALVSVPDVCVPPLVAVLDVDPLAVLALVTTVVPSGKPCWLLSSPHPQASSAATNSGARGVERERAIVMASSLSLGGPAAFVGLYYCLCVS